MIVIFRFNLINLLIIIVELQNLQHILVTTNPSKSLFIEFIMTFDFKTTFGIIKIKNFIKVMFTQAFKIKKINLFHLVEIIIIILFIFTSIAYNLT